MIVQMLEVVEELMIAVVGGSAEIVGWPQKIVLCTAGVGADITMYKILGHKDN